MSDIDGIKRLNATDENIDFSSRNGPCKYVGGESFEIRQAKCDKILESIKNHQIGPTGRVINEMTEENFKWKVRNGQ